MLKQVHNIILKIKQHNLYTTKLTNIQKKTVQAKGK